ncbi:MAG: CopG family transcriptional regulator [Flavobacteriales bacterium]|nr:CopG family transcriptional regulator [Flavobacteriales bacterium]
MPRQSITFTTPNDEWLNAQVSSREYNSKSEVINDLIRRARAEQEQIEYVRARLKRAEDSGFTDLSAEEIRQEVRNELGLNG